MQYHIQILEPLPRRAMSRPGRREDFGGHMKLGKHPLAIGQRRHAEPLDGMKHRLLRRRVAIPVLCVTEREVRAARDDHMVQQPDTQHLAGRTDLRGHEAVGAAR